MQQQQEVMHVDAYGGNVIGNGKCQSDLHPLRRYWLADSQYEAAKQGTAKTLHYLVEGKIACGAAGGVGATDLSKVTCKNCSKSSKINVRINPEEEDEMSTEIEKKKRNAIVTKKAKSKKAAKEVKLTPCGCGCGEKVKAKFAVGHDARFHGWVKRVGDGRMKLSELNSQVRKGMFAGKSENEKGVKPAVTEDAYLKSLGKEI